MAIDSGALHSNDTGDDNLAIGVNALFSNTGGFFNVASGNGALYSNTTGQENVASGYQALYQTALTNLTLVGDTLTWEHNGSPRSAQLHP